MSTSGRDSAAIIARTPLAVVLLDGRRRLAAVNPAAASLLGRDAEELVGAPASALFPPGEAAATLACIEQAATGDAGHLEVRLQAADGRVVPFGASFAPVPGAPGEPDGIVGIGRDITARKVLEAELVGLADGFRSLAQTSNVGMYRFTFEPDLAVDLVNPALEEAAGYTAEALRADPSLLSASVPPETLARFDANRRSRTPTWPIEVEWRRPDGERCAFSVSEVPIRGPDGRLRAVLGIAQDVTRVRREERALEEALALERAATERLRRVDELRRLFLQAVSHELRTPLTSIVGFSETLRDRIGQLEQRDVVAITGRIHRQATKMHRLLDDLLDIERLTRGVVQLSRRRLDVADLVEAVVAEQGDPGVLVTTSSSPAWVDAAKVERIVVNLVLNARKHVGPDATVHVDVRLVGDRVVLTVEDDGPGVPEALRSSLFEPFEQGPSSRAAASPGTGIGLTLVREFAALHGGTADVRDATLGGAAFVVELPVSGANA